MRIRRYGSFEPPVFLFCFFRAQRAGSAAVAVWWVLSFFFFLGSQPEAQAHGRYNCDHRHRAERRAAPFLRLYYKCARVVWKPQISNRGEKRFIRGAARIGSLSHTHSLFLERTGFDLYVTGKLSCPDLCIRAPGKKSEEPG